jgi:hypothetical protein
MGMSTTSGFDPIFVYCNAFIVIPSVSYVSGASVNAAHLRRYRGGPFN